MEDECRLHSFQENFLAGQQHADLCLHIDLGAPNRERQSRARSGEVQHGDFYGPLSANHHRGCGGEGGHLRHGTRRGQSFNKRGRGVLRSRRLNTCGH